MSQAILPALAIVGITVIELYALHKGINGKLLAASIGLIGALGGATLNSFFG
jgi:hypothetical protein